MGDGTLSGAHVVALPVREHGALPTAEPLRQASEMLGRRLQMVNGIRLVAANSPADLPPLEQEALEAPADLRRALQVRALVEAHSVAPGSTTRTLERARL